MNLVSHLGEPPLVQDFRAGAGRRGRCVVFEEERQHCLFISCWCAVGVGGFQEGISSTKQLKGPGPGLRVHPFPPAEPGEAAGVIGLQVLTLKECGLTSKRPSVAPRLPRENKRTETGLN